MAPSIPSVDIQAVHVGGYQSVVNRIVIHGTNQGGGGFPDSSQPDVAGGTSRYFTDPASGGSAHTVSDSSQLIRCVAENVVAWHAPPNDNSLGNEIASQSWYTRDQWLDARVWAAVDRTAKETAAQCLRWNVPIVKLSSADLLAGKRGICGHVDVTNAWHQSDHTDPGDGFPWPEFIAAVQKYAGQPSAPLPGDEDMPLSPDDLKKIDKIVADRVTAILRAPEFSLSRIKDVANGLWAKFGGAKK